MSSSAILAFCLFMKSPGQDDFPQMGLKLLEKIFVDITMILVDMQNIHISGPIVIVRRDFSPISDKRLISYMNRLPFYPRFGQFNIFFYQIDPYVTTAKVVGYLCSLPASVERIQY